MPAKTTSRRSRTNPFLYIILVTLIILALIGTVIYSLGYRYISTDTVKFSGWTTNGQPTKGSVSYSDGTKGKLTIEKNSNQGKIVYSTGDVYEGTFDGIKRDGTGTITYKSSGDVYTGDFTDDLRTGHALITYANGDTYDGEVADGRMNGKGKYTFSDGSWYYGDFSDNMKNGLGEYHWNDGSYYYGSYVNDMRQGSETITVSLSDGMLYTGKCKQVFANGDEYVGDFVSDARTGKGIYTWANGEKYEGDFVNGVLEGTGTYYFSGGNTYTGMFTDGTIVEASENTQNVQGSDNSDTNN